MLDEVVPDAAHNRFHPSVRDSEILRLSHDGAELFGRIDRNERRPFRQRCQSAAELRRSRRESHRHRPANSEAISSVRSTLFNSENLAFRSSNCSRRVGNRKRIPHALTALGEQPVLQVHTFQPFGLHVQQVVVVPKSVQPVPATTVMRTAMIINDRGAFISKPIPV